MSRHIDFIAVLVIAVAMIGFTEASTIRLPERVDSVHLQNAINNESCPISREVLSRLAYILNR
jgi:hypothetical protein